MTRCYFDLPEELVEQLKEIGDDDIEMALRELADSHTEESDELAQYDSVSDIRNDETKPPAERKRLELKAQRHSRLRKH